MLPANFVEEYKSRASEMNMTFFGARIDEMSRDELMAVAAELFSQLELKNRCESFQKELNLMRECRRVIY